MPLHPDLVGTTGDPVEFSWTHDDAMLYAVAVGAGQDNPTLELAFTTENTEGLPPQVLPTFANILTRGASVDIGDYDRTQMVHAEQGFRLHSPLPLAGSVSVTPRVVEVSDKGAAALVATETTAVDTATGAVLATSVQKLFIRGEGGFGGPRGTSTHWAAPDRAPDHMLECFTLRGQALLYRLTGDRNPLHTDPAFAARGGFPSPILHGMCTYGFTGRVLLHALCDGDARRLRAMEGRFTMPVYPGDPLTVLIWRDGATARFRTLRGDDIVIDRGVVEFDG
jgi:acyl dehydratase